MEGGEGGRWSEGTQVQVPEPPDYCDCQKRAPTSVDTTTTQSKTETVGRDCRTSGPLERNL